MFSQELFGLSTIIGRLIGKFFIFQAQADIVDNGLLVVDEEPDRNGDTWPRLAMVLSHSLMNVAPFQVLTPRDLQDPGLSDDVIRIYPSDLYVDGSMWTLREFNGQVREMAPITDLVAFWLTIWNNATPPT
mgnify:CR=1 FL=1